MRCNKVLISRLFRTLFCMAVLVAALEALADQITLRNGDRITGTVQKLDAGSLVVTTNALGDVRIKMEAMSAVVTDKPIRVEANGSTYDSSRIELGSEKVMLFTADGSREFERSSISSLLSAELVANAQKQEPSELAPLLRFWNVGLDAGVSGAHGNAEILTANVGVRATRVTPRERLAVNFTSLLSRNKTDAQTVTSANAIRSGLRYDLNLSRRIFTFGFTNFESDRVQKLDLRNVLGGGAGLRVVDSQRTQFDVFTGGSFNREYLAVGENRKSGEILVGHDLSYKMSPRTAMGSRFSFYPNMSDTGEYRATVDTTTSTRLNHWLGWQVTLSNIYVSNPPIGAKNNDLLISTGFRVTLGEERPFNPRAKVGVIAK